MRINRKIRIRKKLVALVILLALVVGLSLPAQAAPDGERLRNLAGDFLIGYASVNNFLGIPDTAMYQEVARTEFNILTPENQMKWDAIHPQQNTYNFGPADQHVQFAQSNNMAVHGHTLVWHSQNPGWLTNTSWTESQLIDIMNDHIDTVMGNYAGEILVWDVVNEAFEENGSYRSSFWLNTIGQEYIELAFQRARAADPNAKLIYNDYNIGWVNSKSNAVYNMAADFVSRGIPIDGVGFQMHLTGGGIDYQSLASNMQRFADLGLEIYITEMDVRISQNPSQQELQTQASIYGNVLDRCLVQPACVALQAWGFTDNYSWVPDVFSGMGAALIFDENYEAKPAYYALQAEFSPTGATPTNTPPGPTNTPSVPTPTNTPSPGGPCSVSYSNQNDWGSGATINVAITNNNSSTINGWTLSWTFPGNQQIINLWNGSYSQSGAAVSVSNLSYNGTIGANGGTTSFGFNISYSGSNIAPTSFVLNGTPCGGSGGPTPTAPPPTATTVPPTATSVPPTATSLPPTATSQPPTATAVSPTATSQPPTATPGTGAACSINYVISDDWGSGFVINVTITNNGSSTINGWALAYTFPGNQQITNLWNGSYNQTGAAVAVNNAPWNGTISANGSVSFGFQGTYSGSNQPPSSFSLNGISCSSN